MSRQAPGGVGARLRQDLQRNSLSARALGRLLAGPDASREKVEQHRRYVVRWLSLDGQHGMSRTNAARLAKLLNSDPARYLSVATSLQARLEQRVRRLEEQLAQARAELARLPKPR